MSNSYKTKYEVLKTFKEDQYQTVLIGSNKKKDDDVVVINILHKNKISKTISKSQFPKGLNNLIHLEDMDNDLIVVTEYKEGTPLESYLKFFDSTIKHKINLAYEFLTRVVKYDNFHNSIKKILIDESQILIKDDQLYFNELMFLDEDFGEPIEFKVIASKLGEIIEKIVFSLEPEEDKDNDRASQSILKLINKLKGNDHSYQSIHAVYNSFRKIYIYEIFMEDESVPDDDDNDDEPSNETIMIPLKETLISETLEPNEIIDLKNEVTDLKTEMVNETNSDQEHNDSLDVDQTVEESFHEESSDTKDSSMNDEELAISLNEVFIGNDDVPYNPDEDDTAKEKGKGYVIKIAIAILLLSVLSFGALKLSQPILDSFKTDSTPEIAKPEAYFVYEKIADSYYVTSESKIYGDDNEFVEILWKVYKGDSVLQEVNQKVDSKKGPKITFKNEGEYTIGLSIKDKYGNTDEYKEKIVFNNKFEIDKLKNNAGSEEKLDNLSLTYSSSTIVKDYKAFRSGTYSLRLGKEGKNNSEKIIIDNIDIENKPIVSMWIASSSKGKVSITARGYQNNKLQFSKVISFVPKEANAWEMVEISETTKNIDKIELAFKDFISPIWLDDIEVGSYK